MVPTRELGVQIIMLIYKLFGGAVNSQVPGDAANMFTYTGPRGLKVRIVILSMTFLLTTINCYNCWCFS